METTKKRLPRTLKGSRRTRSQQRRRMIKVGLDIKLKIYLENKEKTDKRDDGEK